MASDKEKNAFQEEEIIDLNDVLEEGFDADFAGEAKQKPEDPVHGDDLEDDFNELFESLDAERGSQVSEGSDLEAMFDDENSSIKGPDEFEDKQDELPGPGDEKPAPAMIALADQLESLSDRMDAFEEKLGSIEKSFSEKVISAVEEKGSEIGFLNKMFEDLKQDYNSAIVKSPDFSSLNTEDFSGEDFKAGVLETIEEEGLELSFVQDITEKITKQTRDLVDEKISAALQVFESPDDQGFAQKIQELEFKIREIAIPDPEEIKQDLRVEFQKAIKENIPDLSQSYDPEEFKQEISDSLEDRIKLLADSWQDEKKTLASEMEKSLMFWEKMQEGLNALSRDVDEIRDKMAKPDPGLMGDFESFKERAVTREDLDSLMLRLRLELEEYILKKVPEAAARVIREEIAAIVGEKKQ
jgi:tetrahydromethanopterin S-methyltransferase subunit G